MRRTILAGSALAALAALALVGCAPTGNDGSVAATVAGRPIRVADLEAEMRITGVANPQDPAVRRAALERMIARKLLARAARDDGLSTAADARRARDISREEFDATLTRTSTMVRVPAPSDADVAAYVAAHPERFASRTIYFLDQIQTTSRPNVATLRELAPTKTLEEAEAVLANRKVDYRRRPAGLDSLQAPPSLSAILAKLPAGELIVLPEGGGISINRVRASESQPVAGAPANAIAKQILLAERQNTAFRTRVAKLRADQVTYGKDFAPATPKN